MKQLVLVVAGLAALALSGCQKEGCLGGEADCKVPPPCPKVAFTCDAALSDLLKVQRIDSVSQRPGGWNGLGTVDDVKLSNGFVDVVIANVGTQNYLDPNGGSILDLAPHGKNKDTVNDIFQVVGLLPRDAAFYTSIELIDERPARVAVQVKGTLDGIPSVPIITRYELTPCDRGVRARTEILNGSTNTQTWSMVDGFYWSGRESLPFAPVVGEGFVHSSFGLTTINGAYRLFPYFAAAGHSGDDEISAISMTSCTEKALEGFHSDQISAAGLPRQVVPPRGSLIFERFFAVADSKGVEGAIDLALEVRKQVLGEQYVTLTGKVERLGGGTFDAEREASVLISEGTLTTELAKRIPWTQAVPKADGTFTARVPAGKAYVVEAHAFGRKQVEREYASVSGDTDLGNFVLPATGTLSFRVEDNTRALIDAELFLIPVDDAEVAKVVGTLHGRFATCAPWLGSPAGASPACNRVLVHDGLATAEVPVGKFDIYAFHGPYWSLARQTVDVAGGPQSVTFSLRKLNLKPLDTVAADLHVHGAASFDSSIPDTDRVLSFAASDLDVVISTDHDVVQDYARIVRDLGLQDRLTTVVGLETTGHIPFLMVPGYGFPLVIGHYNMWPIKFDPSLPRNGGPFDERVEPGQLFERTKNLFSSAESFIELNHPWADPEFGRDLGFPRAIMLDLNKDLPATDDGTRQGFMRHLPKDSTFTNDAHHAQEVMNGTDNGLFLQYRAFWHYTLSQGLLKTGTANSDSHSLTDNTVGMPQNLVSTTTTPGAAFDVVAFNRALKEGHSQGTNGPVIEATIEDTASVPRSYSMTAFAPRAGATVKVKISSAPWVPVEEVRFLVNGVVKKVITGLPLPADPFADTGSFVRYDGEVPLSELTAGVTGDAWLVVEAGRPLLLAGDLGGGLEGAKDGMPDTTDNDGNGVIDAADVKAGAKIGPLADPPKPKRGETGYDYAAVTNGYPLAFTNPFILDLNGDGAFTAPGVKGGQQ